MSRDLEDLETGAYVFHFTEDGDPIPEAEQNRNAEPKQEPQRRLLTEVEPPFTNSISQLPAVSAPAEMPPYSRPAAPVQPAEPAAAAPEEDINEYDETDDGAYDYEDAEYVDVDKDEAAEEDTEEDSEPEEDEEDEEPEETKKDARKPVFQPAGSEKPARKAVRRRAEDEEEAEEDEDEDETYESAPFLKAILRLFVTVIGTFGAVWLLFIFVLGLHIAGDNHMAPEIASGDIVITFRYGPFEKNDMVVYENPVNGNVSVGRIVASGTDTVEITADGVCLVNGVVQESAQPMTGGNLTYPYTLTGDSYFLLNDDRSNDMDSRQFGEVKKEKITGKVIYVQHFSQ